MRRVNNEDRWIDQRVLAAAGLVGLGVIVAAVVPWWAGHPATFRFLRQRTPVYHRQGADYTLDVYCFEGDFRDLCAQAAAELSTRGFGDDDTGIGSPDHHRVFARGDYRDYRRVRVSILKFGVREAMPDGVVWAPKPGWVSVEVRRTRRPLWQYLPMRWQFWYQTSVLKSKSITIRLP